MSTVSEASEFRPQTIGVPDPATGRVVDGLASKTGEVDGARCEACAPRGINAASPELLNSSRGGEPTTGRDGNAAPVVGAGWNTGPEIQRRVAAGIPLA